MPRAFLVGKKKVGSQIRIRGEPMLRQLYVGKEEIKEIIDAMGNDYDKEQIKKELKALIYIIFFCQDYNRTFSFMDIIFFHYFNYSFAIHFFN